MSDKVELSVKSQLSDLIADMDKMNLKAREISNRIKSTGSDVGDSFKKQTKQTETFLGKVRGVSRRLADQIKNDFKSLVAINAVGDSLKLTSQFKGSIKESMTLGDTIRKLSTSFNIADKDRSKFHKNMIKGMGEVGLASESANSTLEGLADTPVRGQEALLEYAKTAGMLASLSNQKGQEGSISAGVARVIQAKGGDVSDSKQVRAVMEDIRKAFKATGKTPTEILGGMEQIFKSMSSDLRKSIGTEGLAKLAASGQVAGPGSTKFLEEMLGKSSIQRKAMEAQGFKDVFTDEGIDVDKFQKAAQGVLERVGGDPRMAAKTLGLTDEAADGFVRLTENLDRVRKAQDDMAKSTGSINDQYKKSMGFGEAFRANINKVKAVAAGPMAKLQELATEGLSKASESGAGSAGVVLGGGLLAALLAGKGLKGIGGGLGMGGMAKSAAVEAATGKEVQYVHVVNANEIGGGVQTALGKSGLMGGGKMGGIMKLLGKAGLVAGAGYVGYKVGEQVNEKLVSKTTMTNDEGFKGTVVEQFFFKMGKLFNTEGFQQHQKAQKVMLELKSKDLKPTKKPSRGVTFK